MSPQRDYYCETNKHANCKRKRVLSRDISNNEFKLSWLNNKEIVEKYFISVLLPYYILNPYLSYRDLRSLGFRSFLERANKIEIGCFADIKNKYLKFAKDELLKFMVNEFGKEKLRNKLKYAQKRLEEVNLLICHDLINFKIDNIIDKDKLDKDFYFPNKAMLIISSFIYQTIEESSNYNYKDLTYKIIKDLKNNASWVREVSLKDLQLIIPNFDDNLYFSFIFYYLSDLIQMIFKLYQKNYGQVDSIIPLHINEFSKELIEEDITMGFTRNTLNKYLSQIFEFLKLECSDFNLERLSYQESLIDDGKSKECGVCHNIKPYSEFYMRTTNKPHYYCIECRNRIIALRNFKNKFLTISSINNNSIIGCSQCGLTIEYLPAISTHHPHSNKTVSYAEIRQKDLQYLIKKLKEERIVFRCVNCHSLELNYSYVFYNFKDFLMERNIFTNSTPILLNKKIDDLIIRSNFKVEKRELKRLLKKRYIIETLFGGYCVGCRNVGIDFLPAFHFHHSDHSIKEFTWSEHFRDLKIPEIIEIILDEQIICLCGNCHQLVEASHFPNIASDIFSKELSLQVKVLYQQLNSNIMNFKINENKISFYDPIDGIESNSDYYKKRYFGKNIDR